MRRKNNPTVGFTLTQIAEGFVNEDAAEEWQARDSGGALAGTAEWARSAAAGASRQLANDVRRAAATVGIAQKGSRKRSGGQRGRRK
jgi:hypothetical protein